MVGVMYLDTYLPRARSTALEVPKILVGALEVLVVMEHVDSIGALAQHCYLMLPYGTS